MRPIRVPYVALHTQVPWKLVLGDAIATVIERAIMYPLETVRTRMEMDTDDVAVLTHVWLVTRCVFVCVCVCVFLFYFFIHSGMACQVRILCVCVCVCVCVYACTCMYVSMHLRIYLYVAGERCVNIHTYIRIYTHTYISLPLSCALFYILSHL